MDFIDASLIVIFLIVWILVFVLSRLFFRPLRNIMQKREERIQESRESYQESVEFHEKTVLEIEEKLKSARALSQQIRDNFMLEALKERERILEEINAECRSQMETAKEQLEKQMKSLKIELDTETKYLAERIEQKFLGP